MFVFGFGSTSQEAEIHVAQKRVMQTSLTNYVNPDNFWGKTCIFEPIWYIVAPLEVKIKKMDINMFD